MKTFKQFMTEMPYNVKVSQYDNRTMKLKKQMGRKNELISSTPTHKIYRVSSKKNCHGFRVSDHHDNVHLDISGFGDKQKNKFEVDMVSGYKDRSIKYHHAIHHLISQGHVKHWKSSSDHSLGSKKTYGELVKYPDLHVVHVDHRTGGSTTATADNINKFYGRSGHFEVTKK